MHTVNLILLILAGLCFIIAAAGRQPAQVQLGWVGAALITLTLILRAL